MATKETVFQHVSNFNHDDCSKYIIVVFFDGEPELWGTDNPTEGVKELFNYYDKDWHNTNRVLPVQVYQKERFNEFNFKGPESQLVDQDQILREAREIIEKTTNRKMPGTIGAVNQAKTERAAKSKSKLEILAQIEGYGDDTLALLEANSTDSVCPGICMNKSCDYTTEVEPDATGNWCEECETQSVKSALVLAGVI